MDLGLSGRTYVVTGGGSGVGLATTAMLLAEGANVATCARDIDRLGDEVGRLPGAERALTARADVLDAAQVAAFVTAAVERFGVLDPVRAALPWLRKSPAPAVVNVNAILARQPEPRLAATSAARAALLNLSTTL